MVVTVAAGTGVATGFAGVANAGAGVVAVVAVDAVGGASARSIGTGAIASTGDFGAISPDIVGLFSASVVVVIVIPPAETPMRKLYILINELRFASLIRLGASASLFFSYLFSPNKRRVASRISSERLPYPVLILWSICAIIVFGNLINKFCMLLFSFLLGLNF